MGTGMLGVGRNWVGIRQDGDGSWPKVCSILSREWGEICHSIESGCLWEIYLPRKQIFKNHALLVFQA